MSGGEEEDSGTGRKEGSEASLDEDASEKEAGKGAARTSSAEVGSAEADSAAAGEDDVGGIVTSKEVGCGSGKEASTKGMDREE